MIEKSLLKRFVAPFVCGLFALSMLGSSFVAIADDGFPPPDTISAVPSAADVAEEEGGGDQKKKTLDAEHHFTPVHRI